MDRNKPAKTSQLPSLQTLRGQIKQWRGELPPRGAVPGAQGQVMVLVDCSGSMGSGDKMQQAKDGLQTFTLDAAKKGYEVGLIRFESTADVLCSPTADSKLIFRRIETLAPLGSTNMAAAIELAANCLGMKPHNRVITLITDGMPDNADAALAAAINARHQGIDIIAIGTDDADASFLKMLASREDLSVKVEAAQLQLACSNASLLLPGPSR